MTEKLIKQGAEARLFLGDYNGQECLIKERFIKRYRHPDLDTQITKERMRAESKAVSRCTTVGIKTPKIYNVDFNTRKIYMEYFNNAITIKDFIKNHLVDIPIEEAKKALEELCSKIGAIIGKMHDNHIIHGDLTTSNILMNRKSSDSKDYEIVFIDFGLSHYSQSLEDKGVDLYVLERALLSTHSDLPDLFDIMKKCYIQANEKGAKDVILKFEDVRARGRKRTMIG